MGMKNPGSGGGEIVQVQGGHIVRSVGRKDRHSKVFTAKGPRDRRVRLSAHTAIQFYDVQDRLGYDRPSKAVDWLIKKAKSAIDNLAQLPPWNPTPDPDPAEQVPQQPDNDPPAAAATAYAQLAGLSFFPAATSDQPQTVSDHFHSYQPESHSADHLGLSLHPFHSGDGQAPSAPEQALFGFTPGVNQYHRSMAAWNNQETPGGSGSGGGGFGSAFNQRGTLQSSSSFSQLARAWDDIPSMAAAASSAHRPHHHQQIVAQHHHHHNQISSIFGTRFVSEGGGGGGFPAFCVPARIHGEDDDGVSGRPSDSSSPNSAHRS